MAKHQDDELSSLLSQYNADEEQSNPRIMIVDDDADVRESLAESLREYRVITCDSGKAALMNMDDDIECVIMDAKMPGMNGFKATRAIHERFPDTPIMIHTAYQKEHNISDVVELGVQGYIPKGSNDINDIRLKVSSLCEIHRLRKERKLYENHLEDLVAEQTWLIKETQHHLMAAESMAAVGRAMGGTSHNIKNAVMTLTSTIEELTDIYGRLEETVSTLSRRDEWANIKMIGHEVKDYHAQNDRDSPEEVRERRSSIQARLMTEALPTRYAKELAKCHVSEESLNDLIRVMHDGDDEPVISYIRDMRNLSVNLKMQENIKGRIFRAVHAIKHNMQDIDSYVADYDIHQGLESTVELLSYPVRNRITFKRDYKDVGTINAYPGLLNQVWHYVVGNAIEAIEDTGTVEITTDCEDDGVLVGIRDDGMGIREEYLPKVFNPYFTTKGNGIGGGLGLSFAYNIMDEYGGSIKIDSEPGIGTTVNIYIPRESRHKKE